MVIAQQPRTPGTTSSSNVQKKDETSASNLRGMSFDEQAASLAPVQKKDDANGAASTTKGAQSTKKPLPVLDDKAVDTMAAGLKATKLWTEAVAAYAKATNWGYVPLASAERTTVLGPLFTEIGNLYEFPKGSSLTAFKGDGALVNRLAEAIQADVFKQAPTEVWGRLTTSVKLKDKQGMDAILPAGHVVKMVKCDKSQMTISTKIGGKEVTGPIDQKAFAREPGLTKLEENEGALKKGDRDQHAYTEFKPGAGKELTPDGKAPKAQDVGQGAIGDCYLMAGMGAVAAQRPDLIQKMIKYDSGKNAYTVTFQERQRDGKFKAVPIKVSAYLPSRNGASAVYAQDGASKQGDNQALWPAIIEKAYAVWKGDYEVIAGGDMGDAMEAITGAKSTSPAIPAEKDVIKLFTSWQKEKKAVCAGTFSEVKEVTAKAFGGTGSGPYSATLVAGGAPVKLVEKSLKVNDTSKKVAQVKDSGAGKLSGTDLASGSVTYEGARVNMTYKDGKAPTGADALSADYRYEELLSSALTLYGNHAYMFVGVEGDKLKFANPWGPNPSYQPKPVSAAEFIKYFDLISLNGPPPGKT